MQLVLKVPPDKGSTISVLPEKRNKIAHSRCWKSILRWNTAEVVLKFKWNYKHKKLYILENLVIWTMSYMPALTLQQRRHRWRWLRMIFMSLQGMITINILINIQIYYDLLLFEWKLLGCSCLINLTNLFATTTL